MCIQHLRNFYSQQTKARVRKNYNVFFLNIYFLKNSKHFLNKPRRDGPHTYSHFGFDSYLCGQKISNQKTFVLQEDPHALSLYVETYKKSSKKLN